MKGLIRWCWSAERREEMLDDATAVGEGREMEPWNPSWMDKSYESERFQFKLCTNVLTAPPFKRCVVQNLRMLILFIYGGVK